MHRFDFAGASEVHWRHMSRRRIHLFCLALALPLVLCSVTRAALSSGPDCDLPTAARAVEDIQEGTSDAERVLSGIEKALHTGDVRGLSGYFPSRMYLNLPTGEKGYYSAEQSYYILKGFFQTYAPVSFAFSSSSARGDSPYGMGTLMYVKVGQRGRLQVFVSLRQGNRQWKLNQITVAQR
jgi:hypothetical protein